MRCKTEYVQIMRCKTEYVQIMRCKTEYVQIMRCKTEYVQIMRCKTEYVQIMRCKTEQLQYKEVLRGICEEGAPTCSVKVICINSVMVGNFTYIPFISIDVDVQCISLRSFQFESNTL